MKYSTALALLGVAQAHTGYKTPSKAVLIIEGLLKGALDYEFSGDIESCITDADKVVADAETAIADFEAGGILNIIKAIEEIATLSKDAEAAVKDCKVIEADFVKLEQMMAPFMNPSDFVYHIGQDIVLNEVNIMMEVKNSMNSWTAGNWFYFGEYIGEALAQVFIGKPVINNMFAPENFAKLPKANLVENFLKTISDKQAVTGAITWDQCDDDFGDFTFDPSTTTWTPSTITKGISAKLNLGGIVANTIEVTDLKFHANWNGSSIYDQDFNQDNTYDSTYAYTVGWDIPSYTPSGHYDLTFTGVGNDAGSAGNVLCINAHIDL